MLSRPDIGRVCERCNRKLASDHILAHKAVVARLEVLVLDEKNLILAMSEKAGGSSS